MAKDRDSTAAATNNNNNNNTTTTNSSTMSSSGAATPTSSLNSSGGGGGSGSGSTKGLRVVIRLDNKRASQGDAASPAAPVAAPAEALEPLTSPTRKTIVTIKPTAGDAATTPTSSTTTTKSKRAAANKADGSSSATELPSTPRSSKSKAKTLVTLPNGAGAAVATTATTIPTPADASGGGSGKRKHKSKSVAGNGGDDDAAAGSLTTTPSSSKKGSSKSETVVALPLHHLSSRQQQQPNGQAAAQHSASDLPDDDTDEDDYGGGMMIDDGENDDDAPAPVVAEPVAATSTPHSTSRKRKRSPSPSSRRVPVIIFKSPKTPSASSDATAATATTPKTPKTPSSSSSSSVSSSAAAAAADGTPSSSSRPSRSRKHGSSTSATSSPCVIRLPLAQVAKRSPNPAAFAAALEAAAASSDTPTPKRRKVSHEQQQHEATESPSVQDDTPSKSSKRSHKKKHGASSGATPDTSSTPIAIKTEDDSTPSTPRERSKSKSSSSASLSKSGSKKSSHSHKSSKSSKVKDESDEAAADDGMDVDGTPKKKVYMSLVKVGNTIIKQIINLDASKIFYEPVTEEEAPGYFKVVKRPMDLITMRNNLISKVYTTYWELRRDMDLMFDNCMTYNPPDSFYYAEAERLRQQAHRVLDRYANRVDPVLHNPPPPPGSVTPTPAAAATPVTPRSHKKKPGDASAASSSASLSQPGTLVPSASAGTPSTHKRKPLTPEAQRAKYEKQKARRRQLLEERKEMLREQELREREEKLLIDDDDDDGELHEEAGKLERRAFFELVLQKARYALERERIEQELKNMRDKIRREREGLPTAQPATPSVTREKTVQLDKPKASLRASSTPIVAAQRPSFLHASGVSLHPVAPLQYSTILPPQVTTSIGAPPFLAAELPKLRRRYVRPLHQPPTPTPTLQQRERYDASQALSQLPVSGFGTAWSLEESGPEEHYESIVQYDESVAHMVQGSSYYTSYVASPFPSQTLASLNQLQASRALPHDEPSQHLLESAFSAIEPTARDEVHRFISALTGRSNAPIVAPQRSTIASALYKLSGLDETEVYQVPIVPSTEPIAEVLATPRNDGFDLDADLCELLLAAASSSSASASTSTSAGTATTTSGSSTSLVALDQSASSTSTTTSTMDLAPSPIEQQLIQQAQLIQSLELLQKKRAGMVITPQEEQLANELHRRLVATTIAISSTSSTIATKAQEMCDLLTQQVALTPVGGTLLEVGGD